MNKINRTYDIFIYCISSSDLDPQLPISPLLAPHSLSGAILSNGQ